MGVPLAYCGLMSILRPELALLLRCARVDRPGTSRVTLQEVTEWQPNWDMVMRLASVHRLQGLMFMQLRDPALEAHVPKWVVRQLEAAYLEEVARNLYLNGKLADVLERFRAEDLPVVLLKGMALVATVYEDGGLRPMCDMDVLVQPGDVTRAGDLLASLGYWPLNNDTFVDSDRVTVFDVHKDIRTAYDMGGLWERVRPLPSPVGALRPGALVPAPEDLLVHLVVNFSRKCRSRGYGLLGHLCDIAETVRHPTSGLDWDAFCSRVHRHNVKAKASFALVAATRLLEAPVPQAVLDELPAIDERALRQVLWSRPYLRMRDLSPRSQPFHRLFPRRRYLEQRCGSRLRRGRALVLYARRLGAGSQWAAWSLLREWELRRPAA